MMVLRLLPWALWAALVLFSVATYGSLPSEIPQHFDFSGLVTASGSKTLLQWLLLPGVAGLMLAGLAALGAALPRRPDLFNFSKKDRFLRLPVEHRGPVVARMREFIDVLSALTVVVFGFIQGAIWRSALGEKPDGMELGMIIMSTVIITPVTFLLLSRVDTAVEEAERRVKAAGGGAR